MQNLIELLKDTVGLFLKLISIICLSMKFRCLMHDLQPRLEKDNLRNCLQPGWKDLSIRYSSLAHAQWNWREIDSCVNSHFQRPLSWAPLQRGLLDLKLSSKQSSNRGNYNTWGWEDNIRSRLPAQDADLTFTIIYNVFLIPWTQDYQPNVFYHGHDSMLV